MNAVVGSLQQKLQEKINELARESHERNEYQRLFEQAEVKLQNLNQSPPKKTDLPKETAPVQQVAAPQSQPQKMETKKQDSPKQNLPKVDPKHLIDIC